MTDLDALKDRVARNAKRVKAAGFDLASLSDDMEHLADTVASLESEIDSLRESLGSDGLPGFVSAEDHERVLVALRDLLDVVDPHRVLPGDLDGWGRLLAESWPLVRGAA